MRLFSLVFFLAFVASLQSFGQTSSGSITGKIGQQLSPERPIRAELVERSTGTVIARTDVAENGSFAFHGVPFASYRIVLYSGQEFVSERSVTVRSTSPVTVEFEKLAATSTDVVVTAEGVTLDPRQSTSSKLYTAETISALPSTSNAKSIESVLLNTAGVVPDEDGRLHVRGEDASLQYVVDGIPITTNLTRVYSTLFDAGLIKALDVQTGGLNAEYGVATAGVMAITTRSGFDDPAFFHVGGSTGSFGTHDFRADAGGNIGDLAGFIAASYYTSGRYLDPVAEGDPIHDDGHGLHLFAKGNYMFSDDVNLTLLSMYNRNTFEIPNGLNKTPEQDQKQELEDRMVGLRVNWSLGNDLISFLGYHRQAKADATSGGLDRVLSATDSAKAVAENEDFFIGAHRVNEANGAQAEYTTLQRWFDADNTMRVGIAGEAFPLSEFFTFAVTNPQLSDSSVAGGDLRYVPYDLTKGGKPFLVDEARTGKRFSVFAQDRIELEDLTINAGLRYDMFDLFEQENAISPRLALAWHTSENIVVRGSYSRMVMQAPVENILASSSEQARILSAAEQVGTPLTVRSEKAHVFELGFTDKLSDVLLLDFVGYGKLINDFIVKAELGTSGIIFPLNLKEGAVAGGELRFELRDWNHISGSFFFMGGIAYGLIPKDGSSPVSAGLLLGEEGKNYSHPFREEEHFPTEHNQFGTSAATFTYDHPSGISFTLGGRFDYGLPFDLTNKDGVGIGPEESRIELRNRGYSDAVIDLLDLESEKPRSPDKSVAPHATMDLGIGYQFDISNNVHAKVHGDIINVLDTPYLYKFESSFGGTHFGQPRLYSVKLDLFL